MLEYKKNYLPLYEGVKMCKKYPQKYKPSFYEQSTHVMCNRISLFLDIFE